MLASLSRADDGMRRALGRVAHLRGGVWVVIAIVAATLLFWGAASRSSVIVDGVRYHYLDDDQMISMRYARNLAEGHGLVWNPGGERVEGYTNFGWTMVMAAVHALGAGDATAALWIRVVNWLLTCAVIGLTAVLLDQLGGHHGAAKAAALVALTLSYDLLFWAVNGFETTLLTAVFLLALVRVVDAASRGSFDVPGCLLAGLLPLVRADAVDLTAAVLLTAAALGARRNWWALVLAAAPLAIHVAFRLTYYGDLLPNTYYLKVAGREHLFMKGLGAIKEFVATYSAAVVLAAAAALLPGNRRSRIAGLLVLLGCARLAVVGADIFGGSRFLAPYVPVVLAAAAAGIEGASPGTPRGVAVIAAVLAVSTTFSAGVHGSASYRQLISRNGVPVPNVVAGVVLSRAALPGTRVVVAAAGCLPYFSRRTAVDLLGKSDRHIARLPDIAGQPTGHSRYDVNWSLRDRPDLIAVGSSSGSNSLLSADVAGGQDYTAALERNEIFRREYRERRLALPAGAWSRVFYIRDASPERSRIASWAMPAVTLP